MAGNTSFVQVAVAELTCNLLLAVCVTIELRLQLLTVSGISLSASPGDSQFHN